MSSRSVQDPSPFRSALVHGVLGSLALIATLGSAAAAIHMTGDVDAASPSLRVALFENDDNEAPALNPRLLEDEEQGLKVYASTAAPSSASSAAQPDLGVDYNGAARVPAAASSQRPATNQGVRINGQTVLPGQSLSQVQNASYVTGTATVAVAETPDSVPIAERTVFERYARPFANPEGRPTVSIIVGGLGVNRGRTQAAIDELPAEVTLSFAPTTVGLQSWLNKARGAGHEVLIEVPMEPYDYGRERAHAQVLRASASPETNQQSLSVFLSKVSGYTGVMNYQGGKFATNAEAADPVFEFLSEQGVAFFEDGSLNRSIFAQSAAEKKTIFGKASAWIDGRPGADEISKELMLLEAEALEQGGSLGVGMSYPITVDLLREWADRLEGKGIVLAPASYYAKQTKTSGQIKVATLDPQG